MRFLVFWQSVLQMSKDSNNTPLLLSTIFPDAQTEPILTKCFFFTRRATCSATPFVSELWDGHFSALRELS